MGQDASFQVFLNKADECLGGAESEFANDRFHNVANRCSYACFLAAVSALRQAGTQPLGSRDAWSHAFVQAQFAGQLISRRTLYPSQLADVLLRLMALRETADYKTTTVGAAQASRAVRRATDFVQAVHEKGGGRP